MELKFYTGIELLTKSVGPSYSILIRNFIEDDIMRLNNALGGKLFHFSIVPYQDGILYMKWFYFELKMHIAECCIYVSFHKIERIAINL